MKLIKLVGVTLFLVGCVSSREMDWSAYGGSRADATVELGFQYNPASTKPVMDQAQADLMAKERCERWGYYTAEAFGAQKNTCQMTGTGIYQGTCIDMIVTREYQCVGDGDRLNR